MTADDLVYYDHEINELENEMINDIKTTLTKMRENEDEVVSLLLIGSIGLDDDNYIDRVSLENDVVTVSGTITDTYTCFSFDINKLDIYELRILLGNLINLKYKED